MRDFVIDHPERMSGSWEVKGDHTTYGLHIEINHQSCWSTKHAYRGSADFS